MQAGWWTLVVATLGAAVLIVLANPVEATPYAGTSLHWAETPAADNSNVRFTIHVTLEAAAFGVDASSVGNRIPAWTGLTIDYGDGLSGGGPLSGWQMEVLEYDPDTGYFVASIIGADGDEGVLHMYTQTGGGLQYYNATLRAERKSAAEGLINNAGSTATVRAPVVFRDIKPEGSVFPPSPAVVRCPVDAVCTFEKMGARLPAGAAYAGLAPAAEADDGVGAFRPPGPPWGLPWGVDSVGRITWDTTGAAMAAGGPTFYSAHLLFAFDAGAKNYNTAIDFLIFIDPSMPPPPPPPSELTVGVRFEPPTPCGSTLQALVDEQVVFDIVASTDTQGHDATVAMSTLDGVAWTPPTPARQVASQALWRPEHEGSWILDLVATTPGNDTAEGSSDSCRIGLEALDILPVPSARPVSRDHREVDYAFTDQTVVPPDIVVDARTWTLDGSAFTAGRMALGAGPHQVCLRYDAHHGTTAFARTTCEWFTAHPGPSPDNDEDEDGITDHADNCPRTPNRGQEDADQDGQGDACSPTGPGPGPTSTSPAPGGGDPTCPSDPDGPDTDRDGIIDACDADRDGDGIPDTADVCPHVADPGQADIDGDSTGDACGPRHDSPRTARASEAPIGLAAAPGEDDGLWLGPFLGAGAFLLAVALAARVVPAMLRRR